MDAPPVTVDAKPANGFLILLGLVVVAAIIMAVTDTKLGVFSLEASVTALGFGALALLLVDGYMMVKLDRFVKETGANTSPFRGLVAVLIIGVLIALGFALTKNTLGVFSLEPAVTALGITFAVLVLVTAWMLMTLQRAGVVKLFPGESEPRAYVNVPAAEEGQHILLIEGIGEKYASRLNSYGLITIPQLLRANPAQIAKQADVTQILAEEWQAMGRLMEIKGIGAQYAEILAMAGVKDAHGLANADAAALLARIDAIEARRKTRVLKTDIKEGHVAKFIAAAKAHVGPA